MLNLQYNSVFFQELNYVNQIGLCFRGSDVLFKGQS